jgi:hypothetical protein
MRCGNHIGMQRKIEMDAITIPEGRTGCKKVQFCYPEFCADEYQYWFKVS